MVRNRMNQVGGATAQVLLLHLSSLMWGQTCSLTQQTGCDMREGEIVFLCVFKCTTADNYMCKAESEEKQNRTGLSSPKIV